MIQNLLDLGLLERLVQTPGIPGREARVAALIRSSLPSGWETSQDALGNLIAHLPGKGPRWMLMAHMDEVGLIVRRITPEGFLRIERIGGIGVQALPGSRLTVWTSTGSLRGVVGVLPQHLDNRLTPELADLYVDIGATSLAEAQAMGAAVGDSLTWYAPLEKVGAARVSAKSLDDRLGCLALLSLAYQLQPSSLACDLYLAFVVQEETMLMGGIPAVQACQPEVVVGVDGTLAFDTPDLVGTQSDLRLGSGPALKWMDTLRSKQATYVPSYSLARYAQKLAQECSTPLQAEVVVGLSTAICPIPYAGCGVNTLALSIPIRYHHSAVEMADLRDVERLVGLLQELVTRPVPTG